MLVALRPERNLRQRRKNASLAHSLVCIVSFRNAEMPELQKQISLLLPLSEWKAVRLEAARLGIPMTDLCRQWMKPRLSKLHRAQMSSDPLSEADTDH